MDDLGLFDGREAELDLLPLYDYQGQAMDALRAGIGEKIHAQVLVAPTGYGKTVVAEHMIAGAVRKGKSALFTVDRKSLLDQTSDRFTKAGIDHGIIGGGKIRGANRPIKIGMIQTLRSYGWPEGVDVIFNDECHSLYAFIKDTIRDVPCPVIGLTATPMVRGLGKLYDRHVQSVTTNELIRMNRLKALRIRECIEIDMDGTPLGSRGEFRPEEIQKRGSKIVGDIVATWVEETNKAFGGPVKTMVFSASIAHGEELVRSFRMAGYDFRQVTGRDDDDERREVMDGFRNGEFPGVVSVAALSKGVDVPDVQCLVLARPLRKSLAEHIQTLGRGMRAFPGMEFCLVNDHTGNCIGFQDETEDFFENGVDSLNSDKFLNVTRRKDKPKDATCSGCGFLVPPGADVCPTCGRERKRKSEVVTVPGQMVSIEAISRGKRGWQGTNVDLWRACCTVAERARMRHGDSDRAMKHARATFLELTGGWPPRDFRFVPGDYVPKAIDRKISQNYRAYKKRQATESAQ